jgi:hypothetical protein
LRGKDLEIKPDLATEIHKDEGQKKELFFVLFEFYVVKSSLTSFLSAKGFHFGNLLVDRAGLGAAFSWHGAKISLALCDSPDYGRMNV